MGLTRQGQRMMWGSAFSEGMKYRNQSHRSVSMSSLNLSIMPFVFVCSKCTPPTSLLKSNDTSYRNFIDFRIDGTTDNVFVLLGTHEASLGVQAFMRSKVCSKPQS